MDSTSGLQVNVTTDSVNVTHAQFINVNHHGLDLLNHRHHHHSGIVVDLGGGDFIPVNYTEEDLLGPEDLTEEDRNLAAALVAVQLQSQQQKQLNLHTHSHLNQHQQQHHTNNTISSSSSSSIVHQSTTTTNYLHQIVEGGGGGEEEEAVAVAVHFNEANEEQRVENFHIGLQNNQHCREDEGEEDEEQNRRRQVVNDKQIINGNSSKKTFLPHKKRIPHKLKKQQLLQQQQQLQQQRRNNEEKLVSSYSFACQLCVFSTNDQLVFFQHLKRHYEPSSSSSSAQVQVQAEVEVEEETASLQFNIVHHLPSLVQHGEDNVQHQQQQQQQQEEGQENQLNLHEHNEKACCYKCQKTFRKQKSLENHLLLNNCDNCKNSNSTSLIKDEEEEEEENGFENEFSDTEDLMDGIDMEDSNADTSKNWYRNNLEEEELELHATEEDLRELEAQEYVCQLCNQQFTNGAFLKDHVANCGKINSLSSLNSSSSTSSSLNLSLNSSKESGKKVVKNKKQSQQQNIYSCTMCDKVFIYKNSLVYHMRGHTGTRPHHCDQCVKSFYSSSALKIHRRMHTGDKPYKCEYCEKNFRQWGDLKYHCISIHSDQRQYQCEYCGKDFARKYSLVLHRRIHTGEKNFNCEYCAKSFRASTYLKNHIRIHTGEKPYSCDQCGKKFRVSSDMKRHMKTHARKKSSSSSNVSNSNLSANSVLTTTSGNVLTTSNNVGEELVDDLIDIKQEDVQIQVRRNKEHDVEEQERQVLEDQNSSLARVRVGVEVEQVHGGGVEEEDTLYVSLPILIT